MEAPLQYYSLLQLQELLRDLVAACPMSRNVWIVAELSDVAERGGHCYMELIQKDPSTGANIAKARATIWANVWRQIRSQFAAATGQQFATGLKVMVRVTSGYHPLYGMNLNITAVNPSFTMGDRERRRREILDRLEREGTAGLNRELELPRPLQRIAVISAAGAAGYGDFMNQLLNNARRLRFDVKLFPAVMQGAQTSASIITRLDEIASQAHSWDCVCIIRGGGSSTDLDGFDTYELASNVAQFPLPVIVGIGHERDTTVLDFIACKRVKTPTAAAEFIVGLGELELERLHRCATALLQTATDTIAGALRQLAYISGRLPVAPGTAIHAAEKRLDAAAAALGRISTLRIQPLAARLDRYADAIAAAARNRISAARLKLDSAAALTEVLGPTATLARGFSITRIDGRAITDAAGIPPGATVVTTFARGSITSTVTDKA